MHKKTKEPEKNPCITQKMTSPPADFTPKNPCSRAEIVLQSPKSMIDGISKLLVNDIEEAFREIIVTTRHRGPSFVWIADCKRVYK